MSFSSDFTNSEDATLRTKLLIACKKAALAVVGETPTSKPTVDSKRNSLGINVLSNMTSISGGLIGQFAQAACADGAITTSSTDTDIYNRVTAIWNDIAGISGADLA